jgi:hypothetical protein
MLQMEGGGGRRDVLRGFEGGILLCGLQVEDVIPLWTLLEHDESGVRAVLRLDMHSGVSLSLSLSLSLISSLSLAGLVLCRVNRRNSNSNGKMCSVSNYGMLVAERVSDAPM